MVIEMELRKNPASGVAEHVLPVTPVWFGSMSTEQGDVKVIDALATKGSAVRAARSKASFKTSSN
jgi:hypothetical protein